MTLNLKYDFMKLIRILLALLMSAMLFSAFSQAPGNFSTLRVTSLNGNMKANGTSLVTADTLNLKADTLRADSELYVRDSTLLQIIAANASGLDVVGNVNNRVLTATGGDSIQGEANFTFDGTTATVNGNLDVGQLRISGSTIEQTVAGAQNLLLYGPPIDGASQLGGFFLSSARVFTNGSYLQGWGNNVSSFGGSLRFSAGDGIDGRIIFRTTNDVEKGSFEKDGQFRLLNTTNQLRLGSGFTTTINSPAPTASRTYTIPDAGANTNFIMGAGANTITDAGSSVPLTITKSGSGNGITVTNSGSGLAGQFGNIGLNANTISSTTGNILITPEGANYTDITAGGLRIAGTERISNAGDFTGTKGDFSGVVTGAVGTTGATTFGISNETLADLDLRQVIARGIANGNTRVASVGVYKHSGITNAVGMLTLDEEDGARQRLWVDNNGILRISTTVTNAGTTTGTAIGDQTSDERLKVSEAIPYGLAEVLQLQPIKYKYTYDQDSTSRLGFGAQTTLGIIPEAVSNSGEPVNGDTVNTKLVMSYSAIIPVLVKAIQELEARVKELEGN